MQTRQLGRTDLSVSNLCLGTMQFGWTADEASSFAVMDAFIEAGGNFIDTADIYSRWSRGNPGGVSEEIIGRWMKARGNRDRVVIAEGTWPDVGRRGRRRAEPRAHHARRRGQPPAPPGRHD
jgi:aryl-alcohol dehydrogenase-like predicted oxidoreductase